MKHLIESGLLAILIWMFLILMNHYPLEALKGFLVAIIALVINEATKNE